MELLIATFCRESGEIGPGNEYVVILDASEYPEVKLARRDVESDYTRAGFELHSIVVACASSEADTLPLGSELLAT